MRWVRWAGHGHVVHSDNVSLRTPGPTMLQMLDAPVPHAMSAPALVAGHTGPVSANA